MKLSAAQNLIVDRLRSGEWELGRYDNIHGRWKMQKGGMGRGGEAITVPWPTVRVLLGLGLIVRGRSKWPLQVYVLKESLHDN